MPLSGSQEFCDELLRRHILCASDEVQEVSGYDINGHELTVRGFDKPLLVGKRDGLRIRVPSCSFLPSNLLSYIDPHRIVDVIDVREQVEIQMTLKELVEHFAASPRTRLLNMLSLEFSQTRLSEVVEPPHVVSELSLVTNCWVSDTFDDETDDPSGLSSSVPSVQKYCLLSMRGSYTDFHIDFGGSSVWYHVLWGEKIFYLVPPTVENRAAYWNWSLNLDHRNIFFPDLLDRAQEGRSSDRPPVFQLRVLPGQTILLPSGWIHAVYTPVDCLVFGGNFLSELHIPSQLNVYRMEQKSGTPMKFQFPNFEKVHWFAADRIVGRLANTFQSDQEVRPYEIEAVRSLSKVLPRWYQKRRWLPADERSYYLPSSSSLELPWGCLINRLRELSTKFDYAQRRMEKLLHQLPPTISSKSDSNDSESQPSFDEPSVNSVVKLQPNKKRLARKVHESKLSFARIQTPGASVTTGGLGWMPNRSPRRKRVDGSALQPAPAVTNDPDVLDAVPELSTSRLVGDHYFLSLSDSDEEIEEQTSFPSKRARKSRGRTRDPDPTWCASSPSKKIGFQILKSPHRLLSPTCPKSCQPTSSLTGGSLHPLLQDGSPETPPQSVRSGSTGSTGTKSSVIPKQPKNKPNTTVRQRLAKRLGIS